MFQMAYSYYGFLFMLITGGVPTALALYTAEQKALGWVWFKRLSVVFILVGASICIFSMNYSQHISAWLGNPDLSFFIRPLSLALFVVPLLSLLRGYLQGLECYTAIAVSELIEQAVRVVLMLFIAWLLMPQGTVFAAGISQIGTALGGIAAFVSLLIFYLYTKRDAPGYAPPRSRSRITDGIWFIRSSLIIAMTRLLVPFSDMLDAIIIPSRLQTAGYDFSQATAMYGLLTGMAVLIAYMPTIVTSAISHTITMKLVMAWKERLIEQFDARSREALEIVWIWGIASCIFLWFYKDELSLVFFKTPEAAVLIQWLFIIPLVVGLREITTSILWSQGNNRISLIGTIIGISIAALSHYSFIPLEGLNIIGAVIGILLMELIITVINIIGLKRVVSGMNLGRLLLHTLIFLVVLVPTASLTRSIGSQIHWGNYSSLPGMFLYLLLVCTYLLIRYRQQHT
ncbi:oligosaccharide flippase family protein [Paenibacillus motobuensis]|uniref:Oligosaccharide flippase family protein n=1 Tax=Paenibacillus motobuensis TaxID=295324 RepID=A0ABP3HUN4_9BACL